MSRSEKRTPIIKDKPSKIDKRLASKAARHCDLSDGCCYKKVYDSYNLHDWKYTIWRYLKTHNKPSLERLREFWKK